MEPQFIGPSLRELVPEAFEPRRVRCGDCSGHGFHWVARLRDPRQDDGRPHTVFCWRCKGTGVFPPRKK